MTEENLRQSKIPGKASDLVRKLDIELTKKLRKGIIESEKCKHPGRFGGINYFCNDSFKYKIRACSFDTARKSAKPYYWKSNGYAFTSLPFNEVSAALEVSAPLNIRQRRWGGYESSLPILCLTGWDRTELPPRRKAIVQEMTPEEVRKLGLEHAYIQIYEAPPEAFIEREALERTFQTGKLTTVIDHPGGELDINRGFFQILLREIIKKDLQLFVAGAYPGDDKKNLYWVARV